MNTTTFIIFWAIIILLILIFAAILTWGIPSSNLLKIERENYWQRHNRSIPPEVKQQREDDDLEYISLLRESNTKFAEENERLTKDLKNARQNANFWMDKYYRIDRQNITKVIKNESSKTYGGHK